MRLGKIFIKKFCHLTDSRYLCATSGVSHIAAPIEQMIRKMFGIFPKLAILMAVICCVAGD